MICDKVERIWLEVGQAAVLPICNFIDAHLAADLQNPCSCLKPAEDWPERTPKSKVIAKDGESCLRPKSGVVAACLKGRLGGSQLSSWRQM